MCLDGLFIVKRDCPHNLEASKVQMAANAHSSTPLNQVPGPQSRRSIPELEPLALCLDPGDHAHANFKQRRRIVELHCWG